MRFVVLLWGREISFILIIAFLFSLLRLPSLYEPYWYGDEGVYHVLGLGINNQRLLYEGVWDNKPPFLYLIYALFSSDQFLTRLASYVVGLVTVFAFYKLSKRVLTSKNAVKAITLIFAFLFAIPLLEGNIANAENFMLLPIIVAAINILSYNQRQNRVFLIHAGLLLSFAFLTKIVAIFDLAAFSLFLFITSFTQWDKIKTQIQQLLPLLISFIAPIIIVGLFFLIKGAFRYFYEASFTQMVGYIGYGNAFIIPQGLLIAKLILLAGFSYWLFIKRHTIPNTLMFVLLWLAFSVFNAFFAGRPYTHYLLVLLASFVLFGATIFDTTHIQQMGRYQRIAAVSMCVILILLFKNFTIYKKNISYYSNFISFIAGAKSVDKYRAFFDRRTPSDYAVASYISMHAQKTDTIFLWGNSAQIYKLTNKLPPGRFTVLYHMSASLANMDETRAALQETRPRFIIVASSLQLPYRLSDYREKIRIDTNIIYERIH